MSSTSCAYIGAHTYVKTSNVIKHKNAPKAQLFD